jgi:hypothetical protein
MRPSYPKLLTFVNSVLALRDPKAPVHMDRYAAVPRTAGIGNTCFGLYVASRMWFVAEGHISDFGMVMPARLFAANCKRSNR